MILKKISVLHFLLFLCVTPALVHAQASMQRGVRISNTNGSIITIQTGVNPFTYTLTLPLNVNPSPTTASLLYGSASGDLNWTDAAGAVAGSIMTLQTVAGNLVPTWVAPSGAGDWLLVGNATASAWNGAAGNFLGTTSVEPLVLATTNTTTPQPIEFYTNNAEKVRIDAAGNVGINQTNPSQLLEVKDGNILLSNSGTAKQLQLQGTGTGLTTLQAGAQGATNINYTFPLAAPTISGQILSSTTGGTMSWVDASTGTVTSVGLALPVSVFNISGSPVTNVGTLTGSFTTQVANTVFAGPASGADAVPTFRTLVAGDIPALGYVTSVGLAMPSIFSVSGSPVTSSGTLTAALTTETANTVFAGPASGAAATPTFRSLVAADIPPLGGNYIINGTSLQPSSNFNISGNGEISGQLQLLGTSTGITTLQAGAQGATNINYTLPIAAPSVSGQVLSSTTGGAMSWINGGTITSVGLAMPSIFSVSGSPVTTVGTLTAALTTEVANTVFAGPTSGTDAVPTFRSLVAADIPALGYVTSVGLALPVSVFNISGSPVTSVGTLTGSFTTQTANTVFAGPSSGAAAVPTFRSLVAADIPALGYVTSVGLAMPSIFSVSGSPVTSSGTLTAALTTETANTVFAGPASGAAATPTFRALVAADIPNLGGNYIINGTTLQPSSNFNISGNGEISGQLQLLGTSTGITTLQAGAQGATNINYTLPIAAPTVSGQILSSTTGGAMSWTNAATGTLTSVGLALPVSVFNISGSPVTTSGTLTGSFTTQTANTVFAGPTLGAAAVPTFRSLVAADIPALGYVTSVGLAMPSIFSVSGSPVTSTGTLTAALTTETANTVFAGPASGAAATPTFRALVAADIPNLGGNYIINGTTLQPSSNFNISGNGEISGQLQLLGTSTGITTLQAGAQGATNINYTLPIAAPTVSGQILSSTTGGAMSWTNAATGTLTSVGLALPVSVFNISGSPVTTSGTLTGSFTTQTANTVFAGPTLGAAAVPTFRSLVAADIPALGYVTSVGLAMPSIFSVSGSPVTSTGTLTAALTTETANTVFAGPASGAAATPTFRALVAADIPNLGGNYIINGTTLQPSSNFNISGNGEISGQLQLLGTSTGITTLQAGAQGATNINYTLPTAAPTVSGQILSSTTGGAMSWTNAATGTLTSVGLALPVSVFNISGSPVTTSGTLTGSFTTQTANTVFAGPTLGAAAVPTFRSLVAADIPALGYVTSVGLAMPSIFSVSGSPVTSTGTLTAALTTETANTVFAGPTSGAAATPTFRALVAADIPNLGGNYIINGTTLQPTSNFNISGNGEISGQLQLLGTGTGITTLQAGAQGATNINYTLPIAAPTVSGQILSSTTGGAMSWTNAATGTLTSVGLALPVSVFNISGSPVTTSGTLTGSFTTQTANTVFAGPTLGAAAVPTFRSLVAADIPALGYVTSVGLAMPSIFSVSGSPVTSTGTLTAALTTETANTVFAGPASGAAATPTFRALVAADIPNLGGNYIINGTTLQPSSNFNISGNGEISGQLQLLGTSTGITTLQAGAQGATNINYTLPIAAPTVSGQVLSSTTGGAMSWTNAATGTVTSVGLAMPSIFSVSGSPVTSVGTLTAALTTETANTVFAGPTSGAAAVPTFRSLVAADIPALGYVTSVGLAMPSIFSVSGSPVTSSGTLTAALTTETANTVFAGPTSGAAATPTFRALVAADIPSLNNTAWLLTGNSGTTPWNGATGNIVGTTDAQDLVLGTGTTAATREKVRITQAGNLQLSQPGTQLSFLGTGTGVTTLQAGAQGATNINYTLPTTAPSVSGQVLSSTTGGAMSWTTPGSGVTSVGLAMPSIFSVSGSPVTSSGTLTATLTTETANTVFAGPTSGVAAVPTFRALVAADLPSLNNTAWLLSGNSGTTAYNGTIGNFLGTTDAQPLVIATTNTTTAQPIEFFTNNIERIRLTSTGKLGIGNTPNTGLDLSADFATRELNYATTMPASSNDMNFDAAGNLTALVRIAAAAAPFTLTGIAGGQNGKLLTIYNASGQSLSIANQNVGSVATNRFITGTGGTLVVPSGGSVNLAYSPTDSRWLVNSLNDISALNGNYVNYNISSPQNSAIITSPNYLFNTAYAASATTNNALGAVITSASGTVGVTNATGLAVTATANGAGTSTGLNVTAGGGTTNYAALFSGGNVGIGQAAPTQLLEVKSGNVLLSNAGSADQLQFQGTSTGLSNFQAGAQGANTFNYTLPIAQPSVNQVLTATAVSGAGPYNITLGWQAPGGGSYVNYNTASIQNSAVITSPNYLYNVAYAANAATNNALGAVISSVSGTTGNTTATGLAVTATAHGTGTSTGLAVTAGGGGTNYAATFSGGNVGVGNTTPNTGLDVSADFATRELNYATTMPASSNDINFDGAGNLTALVRIATAAAPFTLTGLAGGQNGKLVTIYNASGQVLSLANQSASSIAANRFITGTGGTLTVGSGGSVNLAYSPTDLRWYVNSLNDITQLNNNYVNYNISSPQNTAIITSPNYLYNVAYAASATTNNALGAVISSVAGTSGNTTATGLAVTATAHGTGTSTGLAVTAGGGGTNYAATFSGGNVGIGQAAPTQLLEVKSGNLLLSNAGTADQLQFQGTSTGLTTFQAGAQGATNLAYTWPTTAPLANSLLFSSGGATNNLNWSNVGTAGQILTISGGIPSWQTNPAWLTAGNTGLVDNVSNLFGTLDNTQVRFISGSGGPNTRMLLDFNGNMLFGKGATSTSFTSGSGRLAFGDSLSTTRLNSVPTYINRVFNMIDPSAVVRVWRFNTNAGGTDPAIELIGGTNDNQGNAANHWWDVMATGTPGVAGTGTGGQGEHMTFRRRTGASDSEYLSIFAGGFVGIGNNDTSAVTTPDTRLTVRMVDAATSTVSNLVSLLHSSATATGPTAGFGSGLVFKADDSLGTNNPPFKYNQEMAQIAGIWTNAKDANRTGALTFSTVNSGAADAEHVRIAGNGNVGIGTTNPQVKMDINGGLATEAASITLVNGTNNNVANLSNESFARITGPTTAFTITGIAGGSDGQILRIVNTTAQNMTIAHSSASSTAGNRIYSSTGADVTLKGTNSSAELIYDITNAQWVLDNTYSNSLTGPIGTIDYMTKASDQSVTNSIALVNDADISFNTNANETWEIDGELHADNTLGGKDIKIAFTTPAGATMKIYYVGTEDGAGAPAVNAGASVLTASGAAKQIVIAAGISTYIHIHGIFRNAGTGGTVQMKWAQNVAGAGNSTILRQDSFIKATRVN